MLIPLLGVSGDGEPLITRRISGDEAANVPASEVVRRLGIASPVMLCMPKAVLESKPSPTLSALFRDNISCAVGPFSFDQTDAARAWLESGAKFAVFTQPAGIDASDLADAVKEAAASAALPAERLILLLDVPPLNGSAAVQRLIACIHTLAAPHGSGCYECHLCVPHCSQVHDAILAHRVAPRSLHAAIF